jgi:hypothetical protein
MSRQILRPVKVWTDATGLPMRFVWRETTYSGRIVHSWNLSTYWWEPDKHSNRTCHGLETADHQVFGPY